MSGAIPEVAVILRSNRVALQEAFIPPAWSKIVLPLASLNRQKADGPSAMTLMAERSVDGGRVKFSVNAAEVTGPLESVTVTV